jgi:hypothetical protein
MVPASQASSTIFTPTNMLMWYLFYSMGSNSAQAAPAPSPAPAPGTMQGALNQAEAAGYRTIHLECAPSADSQLATDFLARCESKTGGGNLTLLVKPDCSAESGETVDGYAKRCALTHKGLN